MTPDYLDLMDDYKLVKLSERCDELKDELVEDTQTWGNVCYFMGSKNKHHESYVKDGLLNAMYNNDFYSESELQTLISKLQNDGVIPSSPIVLENEKLFSFIQMEELNEVLNEKLKTVSIKKLINYIENL